MTRQNVAWPATMVQKLGLDADRADAGEQREAGEDAGQRDRQHEQQRDRVLAGEAAPREREGGERAEHERERSGATAATTSDSRIAAQMSARAKATSNQCSVRPGGGNW